MSAQQSGPGAPAPAAAAPNAAVPSSSASQASGSSRRSAGPTISIENVELLEADRQHDEKRSRRGSRQQEAAAAAAAAAATTSDAPLGSAFLPNAGTAAPPPSYGATGGGAAPYPGYDANAAAAPPPQQQQQPYYPPQQQQQQPDPTAPSSYFQPNYVAAPSSGQAQASPHNLASRQEPHYGMTYQGGYQTAGSGFYTGPPGAYGYQQPPPPGSSPTGSANEYTNMMGGPNNDSLSSFTSNYGSMAGGSAPNAYPPRMSPPPPANHTDLTGSSNRNMGALTIDDIEKSFNAVVSNSQSFDAGNNNNNRSSETSPLNRPPTKDSTLEKPARKAPSHRRSGSNASSSSQKLHRRSGSTGNLPPVGPPPRSGSSVASSGNRKAAKPELARRRSLSGTFMSGGSGGGGSTAPRRASFSRNHSSTDLASVGGQSITSHHSVVSDISKSALFQGVTEEGHVQLHFPYESVRLVNNNDMEEGRLYIQEIHSSEYESYHLAAEEYANWEHRLDHENAFSNKKVLPPTYYALKIDDDLYRRVLDEVAESHQMPCGLFFCGHHEDVSTPSIQIAMVMVALLFLAMGYVAFYVQA